jgi:hypothetical protein
MKTKFAIPALAIPVTAALVFLLAAPCAFSQETGVSHPETLNDNITATPMPQAQTAAKPTPYVPYADVYVPAQTTPAPAPTPVPAPQLHERDSAATDPLLEPVQPVPVPAVHPGFVVTDDDPTSGVVMEPISGPNELPIATLLHAQLSETISTRETAAGTRFTAKLTADVMKHGQVMIPAGSIISGRVTQLHSGRRVTGPAAIRLQPDIVKIPNGMAYELEADVIDLEHFQGAHVNPEGTIIGDGNPKVTAATFGATTGSGALIGAAVGGGVGAVVGAGIGAGVGTVIWLQRDHQATLASGTGIVFSLNHPLEIMPLQQ